MEQRADDVAEWRRVVVEQRAERANDETHRRGAHQ